MAGATERAASDRHAKPESGREPATVRGAGGMLAASAPLAVCRRCVGLLAPARRFVLVAGMAAAEAPCSRFSGWCWPRRHADGGWWLSGGPAWAAALPQCASGAV